MVLLQPWDLEDEVPHLLRDGLSTAEIAERLFVASVTCAPTSRASCASSISGIETPPSASSRSVEKER